MAKASNPVEGTRGGKLKTPPIVIYPHSTLEWELIDEAVKFAGGRRPSRSQFMLEAVLAQIERLPDKPSSMMQKLAQLKPHGWSMPRHTHEARQGVIDNIAATSNPVESLTIAQAKKGLAQTFNVPLASVEITIRA